jgi:large subunit ribosomal protein L13
MKTYMQKTAEVQRQWHIIDAKGKVLGKVATEAAIKLMGKHKPTYTPHIDGGDHIVVINASQVVVTGNKTHTKVYFNHSHFPGGVTLTPFDRMLAKKPEQVIERAVFNMLPKNRLRQDRMKRLKVYGGAEHKHESQIKKATSTEAAK